MANNSSTQLRISPMLQKMPSTNYEWVQFMSELSKWVTDLSVTGKLTSERVMPTVLLSNRGSVQTTNPATAADVGTTVTVTIAAHTVVSPNRTIAYSAGSITGLAYSTRYFLYADDPEFVGGAVTYLATTSKGTITSNLGRYFVGDITTPAATEGAVTAAPGAGFAAFEGDFLGTSIAFATTTTTGVSQFATTAQVATGTSAVVAVTPATLGTLQNSLPVYTATNVTTDRVWDANRAVVGVGVDVASAGPSQVTLLTEHNALVAAVQELSDVVATLTIDLRGKRVIG